MYSELIPTYRHALLEDVIPFWLRHGMDADSGGIITALDRDGSILDTDKSIWFQGRAGWMFATLYRTLEPRPEWLAAARSCVEFLRSHGEAPDGKLYFSVTREGSPLRMRRYAYSEAFAAIANAALAAILHEDRAAADAQRYFASYLHLSFTPGAVARKSARPAKGIGPLMIGIVTAQELRTCLGDVRLGGATCTEWIERWITEIAADFLKPDQKVLMEMVAPDGGLLDHFDGRLLNPGHAIEAAWFIMQEGATRQDRKMVELGVTILDWMWERGWDAEFGGIFYFRDLKGLPVQEYWQDMKFWWPHCEAIIATLMAFQLTGDAKWQARYQLVHEWSFTHFADPDFGEWFGYLHRDGTPSVHLKGNLWKGPFHLPRMLLSCLQMLESPLAPCNFNSHPLCR